MSLGALGMPFRKKHDMLTAASTAPDSFVSKTSVLKTKNDGKNQVKTQMT